MIKRKKTVQWFVTLLTVCLIAVFVCIAVLLNPTKKSVAAEATLNVELKSSYAVEETIVLPTNAKISADGAEYDAVEGVLVCPNGTVYQANGTEVSLNERGTYTVRYYYEKEGKILSVEKFFNVVLQSATVSSSSSTLQFGDLQYKQTEDGEVLKGLNLKITDTDTFNYNKPIKLKEGGLTDLVTVSHIALEGATSRANLFFRLTDCYDENNYIEYELRLKEDNNNAPILTAFAGSEFIGLESSESAVTSGKYELIQIDDKTYAKQYPHVYPYSKLTPYNQYFKLYYDVATTRTYFWECRKDGESPILINDFSSFALYGQDTFKGFTNNEVYFSFYAKNFSGAVCEMEFLTIGEEKGEGLAVEEYDEKTAPQIRVDYTPTYGEVVYATRNARLRLFDAIVYDVNLASVSKEAFYDYGTATEVRIPVENGEITTRWLGNYTIVYTARDTYGNVSTVQVPVVCVTVPNEEMISIDATGIQSVSAVVGREAQLPTKENTLISTVNRDVTYIVEARYPSEGVSILLKDDMRFTPMFAGEWEIVYTATDNVTTAEKTYTLNVAPTDGLIADGEPILPKYFIKDATYSIEDYYAYSFVGEKRERVALDVAVRFDGSGEYQAVDKTLVKITGAESVSIRYGYQGVVVRTTEEKKILDVGFKGSWNIAEYFQGDFTKEVKSKNSTFTSNVQSGTNTLEFIKEISFSYFNLEFSIPEGYGNFEELKLIFTDYYDSTNTLEVRFKQNGKKIDFYVGTQYQEITTVTFSDTLIKYDVSRSAMVCGEAIVPVAAPFQTDKCYLSISCCDIFGESAIALSKLNNQQTTTIRNDFSLPQIIAGAEAGNKLMGETVTVELPTATDVLSPILLKSVTVSVKDPNGNYMQSTDGVTLGEGTLANREYQVTLNAMGRYTVQYTVLDQSDKKATYLLYYSVLDLNAPEISLKGELKTGDILNVAQGTAHTFLAVDCSDQEDASAPTIRRFICDPLNTVYMVSEDTFAPIMKGLHKVIIRATDASGNSSYVYYYINVQ